MATDFCKRGRVLIGDEAVKPSRTIHIGDIISVRKSPVTFTYKVTGLIEKRGSATLAAGNVIDLTPQEELDRAHHHQENAFFVRDRGTGRPTKKDRRDISKLDFGDN